MSINAKCDGCEGAGDYPIYGATGRLLMWIDCPVCLGDGLTDDARQERDRMESDLARYKQAMGKKA